ncbi:MAG: CYTH and CHAD domain-containing protein [Actinomycetota bacterium]
MLEREVKLVATPDLVLPDLADAVPGAALGAPEERPIDDTYFDTVDLRLARWGCTVRFRMGDGWTVKLPVPGTGRVLARQEIVLGGEPGNPPAEVVALVRPLTRGASLGLVARFDTARTVRRWTDAEGTMVAELVDDRVTAEVPADVSGEPASVAWRELEVELGPDARAKVARRIAKRLDRAVAAADPGGETAEIGGVTTGGVTGGPDDPRPKLVRAIGPAAEGDADVVEVRLGSAPTARQVIAAAISRSTIRLMLHLPAARLGHDIEGVHQARVATRRLRSDLRTFRPLLDREWAAALSEQLRWLADDLGKVRDTDVLSQRLAGIVEARPDLAGDGTRRVLASLERRRKRESTALLDHLDSERADRVLDQLVAAGADPRTTPEADGPARELIEPLVARRWKRVDRAVLALDDPPVVDDLHRARILAKRARYAAEAARPAARRKTADDLKTLARSMARLQDQLGELNDAAVAEAFLAGLAARAKGETAFAAGRMCQIVNDEAAARGVGWQRHHRRASKAARRLGWR